MAKKIATFASHFDEHPPAFAIVVGRVVSEQNRASLFSFVFSFYGLPKILLDGSHSASIRLCCSLSFPSFFFSFSALICYLFSCSLP